MVCPFCNLANGFHDEDIHATIPIPADKLLPTSASEKRAQQDICSNCHASFNEAAIPPCRNPNHLGM